MANIEFVGPARESAWRRLAVASWRASEDPTIYGMMDLDARPMLARIEAARARGVRLTVTHLVARAMAEAIARNPNTNVVLRRRRLWQRASIDIFMHVAVPSEDGDPAGAELAGVKIDGANQIPLDVFVEEARTKIAETRAGRDHELATVRANARRTPRWLLPRVLRVARWLNYELNFDLSAFGIARDPFGSAAVTSLGMLGIETAFVPLYPIGGPPVFLAVGAVEERAVVDEGEIVVRPMLRLAGTFDHRILDGFQIAKLAAALRSILERELSSDEPPF